MTDLLRNDLNDPRNLPNEELLRGLIGRLVEDLKKGEGDSDKRRQVEEWLRSLSEKYPEFSIEQGLRDYYLAEAARFKAQFDENADLIERLNLGRSVETYLEKAAEIDRRARENQP